MSESLTPAIVIKDLTVVYQAKPAIWDLDLQVPQKTITGIVGPNGSGKTTLLKSIIGIIKPITGTITFATLHDSDKIQTLSYVPQVSSVDWTFPICVYDVVMMGRYPYQKWYESPSKHDVDIVLWALDQVQMSNYKDRHISQLSGGQQQRVFIARALAQQSDILLLDEPFNGIDNVTQHLILQLFDQLKQQGKTIVVVHHDLSTVRQYFDWTFLMNVRHIASGPTNIVLTDENIEKTFYTSFEWDNPL